MHSYIYYNDDDSNQWISLTSTGADGTKGQKGEVGVTGSAGADGGTVDISETAPTSPDTGDIWFDPSVLHSYIYYNDDDSNQWISLTSTGADGSTGAAGAKGQKGEAGVDAFSETTGNVTMAAGSTYILDTSTAITVALPSAPVIGDKVGIIDGTGNASTNNITIARNGHNIQGLAQDMTVTNNRAALELVYYNTANGWLLTNV